MSIYRIVFDVRFSAKKDQFETADIVNLTLLIQSRSKISIVQ